MRDQLLVTLKVSEFQEILENILEEKFNKLQELFKPSPSLSKLMSRQEVASLFGVSLVSIDKWKRHSLLPKPIHQSGRVYFLRDEIEKMIEDKLETKNGAEQ